MPKYDQTRSGWLRSDIEGPLQLQRPARPWRFWLGIAGMVFFAVSMYYAF